MDKYKCICCCANTLTALVCADYLSMLAEQNVDNESLILLPERVCFYSLYSTVNA